MEEKNDMDKVDDVMLPGFRFHPTDEELVGFYLKRKVQQQPLPIELIKQVDIYKYDPWDLPKLATTGEKEWYFYCPRDRKYRNSVRPNRVTGAGFWKATGTDRPIYSSDGTKCIGLKKSLVFYRGRAAKGFKTDWMMHEFRLPSSSASISNSSLPKKPLDKSFPAHDSWAICRIFKKTNSMAQRALSHSWMSPLPEIAASEMFSLGTQCSQFSPENISCTTEIASAMHFCSNNTTDLQQQQQQQQQQASTNNFSAQNLSSYTRQPHFPFSNGEIPTGFMFSTLEMSATTKSSVDGGSMALSPAMIASVSTNHNASESVVDFDGSNSHFSDFSMNLPHGMQGNMDSEQQGLAGLKKNLGANQVNSQWGPIRSIGFPFNFPENDQSWKPYLPWDSPPCPSDMSTSYSTNQCHN